MVPLTSASAVSADLPLSTAAQLARETGRRYHAVMDARGQLIGSMDAALLPIGFPPDKLVRQFTHPMARLRSKDTAIACLQSLRRSGASLAVVNDESGRPVGLLSLEQLLRWLVSKQT